MYSPSAFDRNASPIPGSYQDLGWLDSFLGMGAQGPLQSEIDASARLREQMKKKEAMEAWMNSPAGQQLAQEEMLNSLQNPPMSPIESQVQADEDYFNSPAFEERLDALQAKSTADIERRVAEAMTPMGRLNRGSTINPMEAEMLLNEEVNAKYNRLHGDKMFADAEMIQNDPYLQRSLDPTGNSWPVSWAYPGADIDAKREAQRINAENQKITSEANARRAEEIMTDLFGSKEERELDRQIANATPAWKRDNYGSREEWVEDKRAKRKAKRAQDEVDRAKRKEEWEKEKARRAQAKEDRRLERIKKRRGYNPEQSTSDRLDGFIGGGSGGYKDPVWIF